MILNTFVSEPLECGDASPLLVCRRVCTHVPSRSPFGGKGQAIYRNLVQCDGGTSPYRKRPYRRTPRGGLAVLPSVPG